MVTDLIAHLQVVIKPFWSSVPFVYPLKTSENLWFSDVFRGIGMQHWAKINELIKSQPLLV